MSQTDVETVRRAWDAFVHGGIEDTFDVWTDDCVFEDLPGQPDGQVWTGREGVAQANRSFLAAWGEIEFEPLEFIEAGDDRVIAMVAMSGHGGGSGAPLDATLAWLYDMRDGKVARSRVFASKEEALKTL
jgi:ketosteroid isomerase-like protein